jgi:hypothetical protein
MIGIEFDPGFSQIVTQDFIQNDYHPSPGGSAENAGTFISSPAAAGQDFSGFTRSDPPDIGLYEINPSTSEKNIGTQRDGCRLCIYSNPFRQYVTISLKMPDVWMVPESPVHVTVYNMKGSIVHAPEKMERNRIVWNTKGVPPGTYLAAVTSGQKMPARKLFLLR